MPGTLTGGMKAKQTRIAKLGGIEAYNAWRQEIGRKGGRKSRGGGFSRVPGLASRAGRKGGSISKRNKVAA